MCFNRTKIIAIAAFVFAQGCMSERKSGVPMVDDIGADVSTRYRYRLSCVYKGEKSETVKLRGDLLASCYPSVFSDNGLPIVLRIQFNEFESFGAWTTLLSLCSLSVIPGITHWETTFNCAVELADESDGKAAFDLVNVFEQACSILVPSGFFVYTGDKKVPGRRVFSENRQYINSGNEIYDPSDFVGFVRNNVPFRRALAYAVAVKIKELEDAGKIDVMLGKNGKQRSSAPQHNVIRLDRESNGGYFFVIDMTGGQANKEAVQAVLNEFAESVKEEYKDAFPGADAASLSVAFPESKLKIEGERISGCAVVLTIKPLSLIYDPHTRIGKVSVRFNPNQREDARAWVIKNIKTLARDKNIALVTGQLPPDANCDLLGEKVDGNVMEIEFRTE